MNQSSHFTYTSIYNLQHTNLYSGDVDDPIIDAAIYAMDTLAKDRFGNALPFHIETSIFAQDINREDVLLEDKPIRCRRIDQRVAITVYVFSSLEAYNKYLNKEKLKTNKYERKSN